MMLVLRPYFLFLGLVFAVEGMAQLPDGSIAPDFTATDLDGVEHNLYDLLDEGKQVILEFAATWVPPCWSYALTGALDELYEMYGPDGTDEIRVFFIEADDNTTLEDLMGTGTSTYGDWTSVVDFPIIDNGGSIFTDFGGAYYPTIYTVCPNRIVTESGTLDAAGHTAIFQANSCQAASLMNDPALLGYTGGTTACPGDPVNMSVELMNLGLTNLGYCTIAVMDGATEVLSYDWSGDLGTYAIENVELGTVVFDSNTDFTIEITSDDENTANNSSSGSVVFAAAATSLIQVEIMIDNWPQEISWSITDASGSVIESVSAGDIGGNEGDMVEWWVSAPSEGCYTFEIGDTYGDGIYGSQWGSIDGYCTVKSFTEDLVYVSTIYYYNGSYNFASEQAGFFADPSLLTIGCTDSVACNFAPSAIEDDGSCTYPGCMDPLASNYDSSAGCSAECIYVGCTDPLACNYNPSATSDDGSCDYFPCVNCNDAIDIFISEYCEGTGNNKGVEFYNPTSETIDLSNYQLQRYANGSEAASDWVDLIGSIPPQGTHVLINGQIEDLDLGGGAISPACDPAMQALADQLDNPYPAPVYFNGDDALVLVKNGDTVVDIFGKVGEDPGMAWTDDEANGFIDVGDGATWLTINRTLRRKPDVISGVIENPIVFNTLAEYDVFEVNDWSGLGWHNLYCEDGAAGCTNEMACNFSSIATEDDGSCTYPGCQDPSASNYDEEAGCAGECVYLTYDCASIGQSGWEDESIGLYPEWQDAMHGVAWEGEWVFNIPSIIEEPSSGVEYAVHHINWTTVNGLPDWVDEAEFILGELGEGSQHCIQAAGTPTAPSMYDISAVGEVFISIFGQPFSIGTQTYTAVLEVVGNPNPIPGCTYSMASNYISYATEDDGSCLFTGCMDPQAANYTPLANIDDGSCTEDCAPDADSSCTSDNNGDGVVNVSDLLILLGEFGLDCE